MASVRHYLQDVGSTFGTGALEKKDPDDGYEYLYEGSPLVKRMLTAGLATSGRGRSCAIPRAPEIGRFQGDRFEPEAWRPRVPAAAVLRARDDDTFWAALRVMAFTDDMIRAAVKTGEYADPASEQHLADALIKRRDPIGRVYLTKINPAHRFSLAADGALTFENAAVRAGFATAPAGGYKAAWHRFDNAAGTATLMAKRPRRPSGCRRPLVCRPTTARSSRSPSARPILATLPGRVPSTFTSSGRATGWTLVGLERLP